MKRNALLPFLVIGTLATPVLSGVANASSAAPQDREQRRAEPRIYDRDHRDYHVWDDVEDHSYRAWLATKRFTYRQYSRLKGNERRDYWRWRHDHKDGDRDSDDRR